MPRLELDSKRLDPDSILALIAAINEAIHRLVVNPNRWNDLKSRCVSLLVKAWKEVQPFEFSEECSVISNLYWGIEGIESGMRAMDPESRLQESERMLQVPALLEELGTTSGVPNGFLVCMSYLYLAAVKRLQRDDWQVAMHFLQALLVDPWLVRGVLAPEVCEVVFASRARGSDSVECAEEEEAVRKLAQKYRDHLMYCRVMLYGERFMDQYSYGCKGLDLVENNSGRTAPGERESKRSSDSSYEMENGHITSSDSMQFSGEHSLVIDGIEEEDWGGDCEFQAISEKEEKPSMGIKRRLQDMLEEPQTDSDVDLSSSGFSPLDDAGEETESEDEEEMRNSKLYKIVKEEHQKADNDWKQLSKEISPSALPEALHHRPFDGDYGDFNSSISKLRDRKHGLLLFDQIAATSQRAAPVKRQKNPWSNKDHLRQCPVKDLQNGLLVTFKKAISKLCFSEGLAKLDEEKSVLEITAIYEMLDSKIGLKYTMLKEFILEQLLTAISTSKEERVVRMSVSILATIASRNRLILQDIKQKCLRLCNLASALKRNVHEAAILIYLIKPSPMEIKTLELLPTLVEVVCSKSNHSKLNLPAVEAPLTPRIASLMIIEVLVTALNCMTNSTPLAMISSPRVLHGLLDVTRDSGDEELIALATIILKCMQFDGRCRVHISQFTPVAPFLCLLGSNKKQVKFVALEFFHEILCIPRSAAIGILQRMRKEGGADLMQSLMLCLESLESHHRLFAANLLIQLDVLENSPSRSEFTEAAMRVLLVSMSTEVDQLAASILSNLGGTYAWTGEPYTVAWLVKKAGLTSSHHRSMIKDFDWEDESLQDMELDSWRSKVAKSVILIGETVFVTLGRGLKSKIKQISRDSLTAIVWLGYEIARSPHALRYSACEILFGGLEQFLHPGIDLEERLLACLCIYNYASGKGMQKLIHFSEGVRESLRRLSGISRMAEELHQVADYYLPHKSRISCVHTQILETGRTCSGAVNALVYYNGLLWSGHSDGSIKVWDIKGQTATLVWDRKEHNKEVTCFSLFRHGESLLSGSSDGTIKVWKMVRRKLECVEVMHVDEPIKQLESHGEILFVVPQRQGIKALDSSRMVREIYRSRKVNCLSMIQGRIYASCNDSSILELSLANYHEREIKAAPKRWKLQRRLISSILAYKDWVYTAGPGVEGSNIKEWRRKYEAQTRISPERGACISAIGVVEDFMYLCCTSTASVLQIWLRGTQQKVGRVSAGSRITSLLTANDMVICGTEAGLIKGWIPL